MHCPNLFHVSPTIFHINPKCHSTSIVWNPGLTWNILNPTCSHRYCSTCTPAYPDFWLLYLSLDYSLSWKTHTRYLFIPRMMLDLRNGLSSEPTFSTHSAFNYSLPAIIYIFLWHIHHPRVIAFNSRYEFLPHLHTWKVTEDTQITCSSFSLIFCLLLSLVFFSLLRSTPSLQIPHFFSN